MIVGLWFLLPPSSHAVEGGGCFFAFMRSVGFGFSRILAVLVAALAFVSLGLLDLVGGSTADQGLARLTKVLSFVFFGEV